MQKMESAPERSTSRELADKAGYSRAQFYRRHRRENDETPVRIQRRLLLERAAYEVSRREKSITEIAFDAGFESLEGFARAFRSAFGMSARTFQRRGVCEYRFDLTHRVHFHPQEPRQGRIPMDMTRRLVDDHFDILSRLLDALSFSQLEETRVTLPAAFPWMPAPTNLRELLDNCFQHEPWLSTINDERFDPADRSLETYRSRLAWGRERFAALLDTIEGENLWDLTFVDKEYVPPEVFSYGFIVGFTITYNAYHRVALEGILRSQGLWP